MKILAQVLEKAFHRLISCGACTIVGMGATTKFREGALAAPGASLLHYQLRRQAVRLAMKPANVKSFLRANMTLPTALQHWLTTWF